MEKASHMNDLSPVSETLYIPLLAKAQESKRPHPILVDPMALEISERLHFDLEGSGFNGGSIANQGIIVRTEVIDEAIKKHLSVSPSLTVINLGAGLDTRISRIDDERIVWYDLDLPEVIELRRRYFSENDRVKFIAESVLDPSWVSEIAPEHRANVVIVAEGILMYLSEVEVKQVMHMIAGGFPGAHMYFDAVHRFFVGKGVSSKFVWGVEQARDIERLDPSIVLEEAWSNGDLHKERQSLLLRLMNVIPTTKNRSRIIHIRFQ